MAIPTTNIFNTYQSFCSHTTRSVPDSYDGHNEVACLPLQRTTRVLSKSYFQPITYLLFNNRLRVVTECGFLKFLYTKNKTQFMKKLQNYITVSMINNLFTTEK